VATLKGERRLRDSLVQQSLASDATREHGAMRQPYSPLA
jgi:hypothetical protein